MHLLYMRVFTWKYFKHETLQIDQIDFLFSYIPYISCTLLSIHRRSEIELSILDELISRAL